MDEPVQANATLAEQGEAFAKNIAEATELSQQIWLRMMQGQMDADAPTEADPLNLAPSYGELLRVLFDNPKQVADATLEYWQAQAALMQRSTLKWLGAESVPDVKLPHMASAGKRFEHRQWQENALFEFVKQSYLLASGAVQDAVHSVGEMAPKERRKVDFFTRQFLEAMNPANFFALNPEVLEATAAQKGENLVRGLKMMLEDVERGKGKLLIRQTDMTAFEVGRDVAITPGSVIWQNDVLQLIQYAPSTENVQKTPVLFIPPWINKYYILDLNPKKSLVKWLVEQGHTVFMISWVNPDEARKGETWDSYMQAALAAIDKVLAETGVESVNLASYCIGGTLTGTLLAWLNKKGDKRVASATFFTSQLDFEDAGDLQVFVDEQTVQLVDGQMEKGYLPASAMANAFNMLRSNDLIWSYVVNNYMLGKEPFPFDLLYWNADSTAMPAHVHHFYLEQFYTRNNFAKDELVVQNSPVKLADITVPVYHVASKEDHIAPAHSVFRGAQMMTHAAVRFVVAGSGHIAGVVNPPAAGKYQFWSNDDESAEGLESWLAGATETPGSWWGDWDTWLKELSAQQVPARAPGAVLGALEPAPGGFVKRRFDAD